ncbi:YceI family protein [Alteromonas sp. ASW11-19]|uniref:YceI family protein n=1 Tax=Alteromonas salexigens TaxID=2982530 RepID=A0ABT2VL35_9ALTE|nr:YceI family protein [Alteromonas salexigens]MCU7553517.1 YceI family protein [Alteromonas salexigens]
MKFSLVTKITTALALCTAAGGAMADWTLDNEQSSLHFLSTKNAQVTEVHTFTSVDGSMDDDGTLTVEVDLASVDTGIEIRDTRMQKMLFNTDEFTTAQFTANVAEALRAGEPDTVSHGLVDGTLSLHGMAVPFSFTVSVARVGEDTLVVSTTKPTLLDTEAFGLTKGVNALREVAGLQSITTTVPVSFSATFRQ